MAYEYEEGGIMISDNERTQDDLDAVRSLLNGLTRVTMAVYYPEQGPKQLRRIVTDAEMSGLTDASARGLVDPWDGAVLNDYCNWIIDVHAARVRIFELTGIDEPTALPEMKGSDDDWDSVPSRLEAAIARLERDKPFTPFQKRLVIRAHEAYTRWIEAWEPAYVHPEAPTSPEWWEERQVMIARDQYFELVLLDLAGDPRIDIKRKQYAEIREALRRSAAYMTGTSGSLQLDEVTRFERAMMNALSENFQSDEIDADIHKIITGETD